MYKCKLHIINNWGLNFCQFSYVHVLYYNSEKKITFLIV